MSPIRGYVLYDSNDTNTLGEFISQAEWCEYIPVTKIRTESLLLLGEHNCFNLKKAESVLFRPITINEIARTLSHIECWHHIAENDEIASNDFVIIAEANVTLSPNYFSALSDKVTQFFQYSPRELILLEHSMTNEYWNNQVYDGEGELNAIVFNHKNTYHDAYCQMYLIKKSLVQSLLVRLQSEKPYWLAHHFAEFCDLQQLGQVSPLIAKPKSYLQPRNIQVKNIDETLDFILANSCSVIRFGDGEFCLMDGKSIAYQPYHPDLALSLQRIVNTESSNKRIICIPDIFNSLAHYNNFAQSFWAGYLKDYRWLYEKVCQASWYGSATISRPYIDWQDKSHSERWFNKLKKLWEGKDILIVEGETSRSGVGNDLFTNAKSIKRIIGPSKNAYAKIEEIRQAIIRNVEERLILLMLGPTAKVLAWELSELGHRAIDIGHIDSEYEWFKMGATEKVKLNHKHTAEFNEDKDIIFTDDASYLSQIVYKIL